MRRVLMAAAAGLAVLTLLAACTPPPAFISVNGRTLLMHPSTGTSADALGFGILGTNSNGCVTMGDSVLVVPDGSALAEDGSITVMGNSYEPGSQLKVAGGGGDAPKGAKCGSKANYFWVG